MVNNVILKNKFELVVCYNFIWVYKLFFFSSVCDITSYYYIVDTLKLILSTV